MLCCQGDLCAAAATPGAYWAGVEPAQASSLHLSAFNTLVRGAVTRALPALPPATRRAPCPQKGSGKLGYEAEAFAIYDTMRYIKPPVATVCVGSAFGEAAMLLAAGEPGRRAALPSTSIMIRQPMQRFTQMQASRRAQGGGGSGGGGGGARARRACHPWLLIRCGSVCSRDGSGHKLQRLSGFLMAVQLLGGSPAACALPPASGPPEFAPRHTWRRHITGR